MISERLKEWYVDNTTNDTQVITLYKYDVCNSGAEPELVEGFLQSVPAGMEVKVDFPEDGTFSIVIDDDTVNGTIARYYLSLFESFIVYTEAGLCGDGTCVSVTDNTNIDYTANALAKGLYYIAANESKYTTLTDMFSKINCSAADEWEKVQKKEEYMGKTSMAYLLKVELAHLYKTLRSVDIQSELETDIDELYDYDNISYCIQKLGICEGSDTSPLPGTKHTTTITANPMTLGAGVPTSISISYKFTANDDTFTEIVETNIPNVTLSKLDGITQTEIIPNQTAGTQYYITYKYTRGGSTLQNTISVTTTAYPPQWYGGESTTATFNSGGQANAATIKSALSNVQPVYKATASGTSSNNGTLNKYIWWITKAPVKFYIGAFEIPTGPWDSNCDPNSYAIIMQQVPTLMEDGVTLTTLYFYRTCPLQNLTGQTLSYTLTE